MRPRDNIEKIIKKFDIDVNPEKDQGIFEELRDVQSKSKQSKPAFSMIDLWRIIMRSRMTKFAGAAVIIIGIFFGLKFIGGLSTTGVAFADVLEYINSLSYTFDFTTVTDKQASNTVQAMVLEPGRMRMDVGKISSIIDVAEDKSMILFHQFKTAQVQEIPTMFKDDDAGSFLFLCTKSIENLWDMQDGSEEQLGEKEIDGQTVVGFKVLQEGQYFCSETTVWADTQTAVPVLVEMIMAPLDDTPESIKLVMNNFDLDVQLDEDFFSLKVPSGYTLAYQYSLDELDNKTEGSDQAQKIVQALEIWSQGNKTRVVETLLGIDWSQPIEFSKEAYFFSMAEKEYISLKPKDQQEVMAEVSAMSKTVKQITKELLSLGQTALSAQNYKEAEQYFQTGLQLGKLLTRDPDALLIVRLVGISVEKITLNEMVILYTQTNQQEKLQAAQKELQVMKTEKEEIKNQTRGL